MPLQGKKAVFFDAGHTLLEPTIGIADVYLQTARSLGVELSEAEFRDHHARMWSEVDCGYRSKDQDLRSSETLERDGWRQFTRAVARPFPKLAEVHGRWLALLFDHFDSPAAWRPAPGAKKLLAELADRGLIVGVISNWHSALHTILAGHQLRECCDLVLTSAEVGYKKPHPRIFAEAIRLAGIDPQQAAHVGDSWEADVLGARAAQITPIFLARGELPADLDSSVAVLQNLSDLLEAS